MVTSSELLQVRVYFRWAFGITWGVGAIALLLSYTAGLAFTPSSPLYYLAGYGPSLAGLLTVAWFRGRTGFQGLLRAAIPNRVALAWLPAVALGYPVLLFGVGALFGVSPRLSPAAWCTVPASFALTLLTDTGPLGEEFGWRGFALPQIMAWRSPVAAALVVGLAWAAWHLPTFFIRALPQGHASMPLFLLSTVALSVAQTRLYLESGGNLAPAVLLHLTTNYWASLLPLSTFTITNVVLAALAMTSARMWIRPRYPS